MHQIRFQLGSATDPVERAYTAPPDSPAGINGPISKKREGKEEERKEGEYGKEEGRGEAVK